jgi:AraC-like DNA-binding protein
MLQSRSVETRSPSPYGNGDPSKTPSPPSPSSCLSTPRTKKLRAEIVRGYTSDLGTTHLELGEPSRSLHRQQMTRVLAHMVKKAGLAAAMEFATRSGKSPTTLRHLFKAELGVSMREYIQRRRLHFAAALLLRTKAPIKLIQYRCRFSDPSAFSNRFRRHFGLSPMSFRKRYTGAHVSNRQHKPIECNCV